LISNYISTLPALKYVYGNTTAALNGAYPDTKFAVISDTHFYDTSLGTAGSAFEKYLASDRKLLRESGNLVSLGIDQINQSDAKFVLVTGDLTKDGELVNHQHMAENLAKLTQKGKKVYVVPGNHDVNNPESVRYESDKTSEISNTSAAQFASIYKDCGYGDAVMRDQIHSAMLPSRRPACGLLRWIHAVTAKIKREAPKLFAVG
jgi:predicted MPP superfamily phosphohydrolase